MDQINLLADMLHKGRYFLSEIAVVDGTLAEGEGDFLEERIIGKIGGQRLAKLVHEVIGAERSTSDIFDVRAVTAPVDTHAVTHNMFHNVIMYGAAKEIGRASCRE